MKRIAFLMIAAMVLLCRTPTAEGTMTYGLSNYKANRAYLGSGGYNDPLYNFINEVETGALGSVSLTTLTFSTYGGTFDNATNNKFEWNENSDELIWTFGSNTVTASSSDVTLFDYGTIVLGFDQFKVNATTYTYPTADGTSGQVLQTNGSGVLSWAANGGGISNLDGAYNGGATIDVDGDAVTLTVSDTDNNVGLIVAQNDSTNDPTAVQITSAADAANAISLDIDGQTTGRDIEGTGASFYVEGDGSIVGVDLDITGAGGITLQNDATILNDVDTEIQFADGTEDISFGFGTSNTLLITTDSGVDTVNWGDVDAFVGVGGIAFDAAAAAVTTATNGAGQDLTVSVTGATNSSLVLASAGTGTDALTVTASAGGIDISSQEDIDITTTGAAGEDITIQNSGGSVIVEATEAAADAIVLNASTALGGIDITSNADIDITTTGAAGEDITITNTGGSVNITATENDADAMQIGVNGGTSESLNLYSTQGTGEDAIDISATAGGIDIDAATGKNIALTGGQIIATSNENVASAINLVTNTGTSETIVVTNTQGTGAGAITLAATAGGVDIDAAATLDVAIAGGQVALVSKDNAASAISLTANVGASETIVVTNTQGTDEAAVSLVATAGGVNIDGAAAKNVDIAGGQVLISSKTAEASAIALTTNVGAAETIVLTNTQGTGAAAIDLQATAGGITLNGGSGGVVFTAGQTRKVKFDIASVVLDGTNPPALAEFGTDGQTQINVLQFDADGGATGDDVAFLSWQVPDGYIVDSARLNVAYTFSTAEDAADEAQFDFAVNAVASGEALDAAGTALADQTTVITDASADNGKMFVTQYNIEVEDIAVDDLVTILIAVDESASALTASGTLDVLYFEIEYESTE